MKKLFLIFGLASAIASAQCDRVASNFGNNSGTPSYNVTGMVQVRLNTNNTFTVNLGSNFSTAAGPDVKIFLVDRGTLTDTQLKNVTMFNGRPKIQMTDNGIAATGAQTFTKPVPQGFNVSEVDTVYFLCQQFSAFWDFGIFTEFTQANCLVLDNEAFVDANANNLYPNPVENQLNFENFNLPVSYKVYDAIGSLILSKENVIENSIDFSTYNTGIYFVELTNNNITQKRKIIKN